MARIPRRVFLLGPDEWDEGYTAEPPIWLAGLLGERPNPFTPRHLRLAAAAGIARRSGGGRRGFVMRSEEQRPGESDARFFRRLEVENEVDSYFIVLPLHAKLYGTVFEGGMLVRDSLFGRDPSIVLFIESGFAKDTGADGLVFLAKGKRTRYLRDLVAAAEHAELWETYEDLMDAVSTWAESWD